MSLINKSLHSLGGFVLINKSRLYYSKEKFEGLLYVFLDVHARICQVTFFGDGHMPKLIIRHPYISWLRCFLDLRFHACNFRGASVSIFINKHWVQLLMSVCQVFSGSHPVQSEKWLDSRLKSKRCNFKLTKLCLFFFLSGYCFKRIVERISAEAQAVACPNGALLECAEKAYSKMITKHVSICQ